MKATCKGLRRRETWRLKAGRGSAAGWLGRVYHATVGVRLETCYRAAHNYTYGPTVRLINAVVSRIQPDPLEQVGGGGLP